MSQTHSIPRFDSTIRVKAEEDIEKQNQTPLGEGTPVVLPSGGYPSAGSAGTGLPFEGRQRTYTGSTFTQSKLITENAFSVFVIYKTRKVLVARFFFLHRYYSCTSRFIYEQLTDQRKGIYKN